jgi:hypothetical protein
MEILEAKTLERIKEERRKGREKKKNESKSIIPLRNWQL